MSRPKIWVSTPPSSYTDGPQLSISVLSASGLPRKGIRELFRGPDASAYVRVDSTERGHTTEIKRSANPRWNYRLMVPVKHSTRIEIEIVHQTNREQMLGSVEVKLDEVSGLHLGPVSLKPPILKSRSNGEEPLHVGKLSLELCCMRGNTDRHGHLPPGWEWRLDENGQIGYYNNVTLRTVYARPSTPTDSPNDLSPDLFKGLNWIDRQGLLPSGWTWTNIPSAGRQFVNQRTGAVSWVRPCTITYDDPTGANNPRPNDLRVRKQPLALLMLAQMDMNNDEAPSPRVVSIPLMWDRGPQRKRRSKDTESHLNGFKNELKKALVKDVAPKGTTLQGPSLAFTFSRILSNKLERIITSEDPFLQDLGAGPSESRTDHKVILRPDLPLIIPPGDITFDRSDTPYSYGGFCDLFVGMHRTVGKVALKRLRVAVRDQATEEMRSLKREARTWQKLIHSHILRFLGTAVIEGQMFLVSPFMENGALKAYISRHPGIDRTSFIRETVSALIHLHGQGIIHGDIKADNILVSPDIHALVCDFGLARMTDASTSTDVRGAGSIRWQCPHLLRGAPKSFASDVFALGMTIYEILSGHLPYHHLAANAPVINAILAGERPQTLPLGSRPGLTDYAPYWYVAKRSWLEDVKMRPTMTDAREWMEEEAPSTADSKPAVRRGDVGSPVGSAVYSYVSSYLSFRTAESR